LNWTAQHWATVWHRERERGIRTFDTFPCAVARSENDVKIVHGLEILRISVNPCFYLHSLNKLIEVCLKYRSHSSGIISCQILLDGTEHLHVRSKPYPMSD
jgi:hypothetical protein